jgi:hypothetical protein
MSSPIPVRGTKITYRNDASHFDFHGPQNAFEICSVHCNTRILDRIQDLIQIRANATQGLRSCIPEA